MNHPLRRFTDSTRDSTYDNRSSVDQVVLFCERSNTIHVSRDHQFQPHVAAFVQKLESEKRIVGIHVETVLATMDQIRELRDQGLGEASNDPEKANTEMQRRAQRLISDAVEAGASDIHIRNGKEQTEVLYRINGDLVSIVKEPVSWGKTLCQTIYQSMADVSDATFEEGNRQDARIGNRSHLPQGVDGIRIATTPQVDGYIMVLRVLYDRTGESTSLVELGMSELHQKRIQFLKRRPNGMVVVTGPTGSGKSTTLVKILTSFVKETEGRKHVITVEDPPEYPIPGTVQSPVSNAKTQEERTIKFQDAIKGAMRVDPDVIMIGEIRDTPSANLAFEAAMTGHMVWSTLHTNGSFQSFDRLLDLGVKLDLLTDPAIFSGVISQRLLKVLCDCKKPIRDVYRAYREAGTHPDFIDDFKRVETVLHDDMDTVFVTGEGCRACRGTGTRNRTSVAEVLVSDANLMRMIRTGDREGAVAYWKQKQNGKTLVEHAIDKVRAGMVDPFAAESIVGGLDSGELLVINS